MPAFFVYESIDGQIPLPAPLAEFLQRLRGDPRNFKTAFPALVEAVHYLIAQRAHRTRQGVAVDLAEVSRCS